MGKRIIYERPDGGLSVIIPAAPRLKSETEAEYLERIARRSIPDAEFSIAKIKIVDETEIDTDRTFRDQWKFDAKKGQIVDMPKAREIHMERIRNARPAEFAELDSEFQKHDAQARYKADATAIAKANAAEDKRQALRDLPQTYSREIAAADTPEKLKAIWPEELK